MEGDGVFHVLIEMITGLTNTTEIEESSMENRFSTWKMVIFRFSKYAR